MAIRDYLDEKKIDRICREVSEEYGCTITHFRDIKKAGRGSYEYIAGYGDNKSWERHIFEGIAPEQYGLDKYKGGMIVFSTDVNAISLKKNKVLNFLSKKYITFTNRYMKNKKLTKIISKKFLNDVGAFSIGNFFKGRYVSDGKIFDEKSTSIEILGIDTDILIRIATEVAREFKQETVLLKDFNSGRNILIDQK